MNLKGKGLRLYGTMMVMMLSFIVTYIISFFLTGYITNNIGIEANGYITLAKNFTSYATLITMALNSFAARFITIAYHNKNIEKVNTYYNSVLIADIVIGGVILTLFLLFDVFADKVLNISPKYVTDVKILFVFTFSGFFVSTIGVVFTAFAYVKDKMLEMSAVRLMAAIMEGVVLVVMFTVAGNHLWFVALATFVLSAVTVIGNYLLSRLYLKEITHSLRYFSFGAFKELVVNGVWNSINSLGNTLNSGLDLLVSNLLLSGMAMGQVSISKVLGHMPPTIYSMIAQPYQPRFLALYSAGNIEGLLKELKKTMAFCGFITNIFFAVFVAIGLQFYNLWIPGQDTFTIYLITIMTLTTAVTEGCIYPAYYIYTLTLRNRVPCIITIAGGLLNVFGKYILIKNTGMGVYSVVITTAVLMSFINMVTNPIYMSRCLKVKLSVFELPILKNILACAFASLVAYLSVQLLPEANTWIILLFEICIVTVVAAVSQVPILFSIQQIQAKISAKNHGF